MIDHRRLGRSLGWCCCSCCIAVSSPAACSNPRSALEPAGPGGPDPAGKRLSSAREMLELFNVSDSELRQFVDGRPLVADEEESLWKSCSTCPGSVWTNSTPGNATVLPGRHLPRIPSAPNPGVFRGGPGAAGRGRQLPPESAARLQFAHFYQVDLVLNDGPNPVTVYTRNIPDAWRQAPIWTSGRRAWGCF
jgi:hypothetical protein